LIYVLRKSNFLLFVGIDVSWKNSYRINKKPAEKKFSMQFFFHSHSFGVNKESLSFLARRIID